MALILNGDTIPYNTAFSFAGQPVHQVDVCFNQQLPACTVWMDTEPQGRIRMTWDSVVFPALSCTINSEENGITRSFGGMEMKYCGDYGYTGYDRSSYCCWVQCDLTGYMCIDCIAGVSSCYSITVVPTTSIGVCYWAGRGYSCIPYCDDITTNLTWTTGEGCTITCTTCGVGDCQYYPMLRVDPGVGNPMFEIGIGSAIICNNTSCCKEWVSCIKTGLYINIAQSRLQHSDALDKSGRTFPLSMYMCRGPIDVSACINYYYVSVGGNRVSDANGNAICFTRAQLTNGICVNFATAKLIN